MSSLVTDGRQITFVTLNGFCPLTVKQKNATPLFLTDNIKMDRIPTKSDEKDMPLLFCISSFEHSTSHFIKTCKIEPPDLLFLVVFTSFSYLPNIKLLK